MSPQAAPVCPKCGQNDQVEKVSTVYLQGIGVKNTSTGFPEEPTSSQLSKHEISKLRKLLAPPTSGKKELTRPIHPDLMVLVFTGLLPIFMVGIAGNQRGMLLPVLGIVVIFYLVYFWMRKRLIVRYQQQKQLLVEEKSQVEKAVGRWMKTFICMRDDVLFREGGSVWASMEQADQLLWKD